MPDISIPPWLQLNIAKAPDTFLQGFGQGASAGSAATAAVQRDQEMAFQQQQAEALNDIRRQEMDLKAQEFQLGLRERQKKAEQEAQEAAIQMEGMQNFQKDLDAGLDPAKAVAKNSGKLFYKHPQAIPAALKLGLPIPTPQPGWTPSGAEYMSDPRGGVHFTPQPKIEPPTGPITAEDVLDASGRPTGTRVYRGAHGAVHQLKPDSLSVEARLRAIGSAIRDLNNTILYAPEQDKAKLRSKQQQLREQFEKLLAPEAIPTAPLPRPANPSELKNGQTYQFPDGRFFRFTGTTGKEATDKSKWEEVAAGKIDEAEEPDTEEADEAEA